MQVQRAKERLEAAGADKGVDEVLDELMLQSRHQETGRKQLRKRVAAIMGAGTTTGVFPLLELPPPKRPRKVTYELAF